MTLKTGFMLEWTTQDFQGKGHKNVEGQKVKMIPTIHRFHSLKMWCSCSFMAKAQYDFIRPII